jgi:DnaJ-class molecular chaperone
MDYKKGYYWVGFYNHTELKILYFNGDEFESFTSDDIDINHDEINLSTVKAIKGKRKPFKIEGSSTCPFCNGSKTPPFVRKFSSRQCTMCKPDGTITNMKLYQMDLKEYIE